jgi:micrococcal nuclease
MKKEDIITLIIAGLFLVSVFLILFLSIFYKSSNPNSIFFKNNTAINIIDGDTFEYVEDLGDHKIIKTIRLLCVDTPEINQTGYEEAKKLLEDLILYKQVVLIQSSSGPDKDAYGRYLRYVYVNGAFVNKIILDSKKGELLIIPPEDCRIISS